MIMKRYNMTLVFNADRKQLLFCRRVKDPYKNKLNFPGGKLEDGETSMEAAYRELEEETGLSKRSVSSLKRIMDLTYYGSQRKVEVYACRMIEDKEVRQEEGGNPLVWIDIEGTDFDDLEAFAGDGNVRHCILMSLKHMG